MKNRTKLWLLFIISMICSLIIFLILSLIAGRIWNKGYDLNSLEAYSNHIIEAIHMLPTANQQQITSLLDQLHTEHSDIQLEWIDTNGNIIYATSGVLGQYPFQEFADLFLHMPENLWTNNSLVTLIESVTINEQSYYLLMKLPSEAIRQGQVYFYMRSFHIVVIFIIPLLLSFMVPYLLFMSFFSSINRRLTKLNQALNQTSLQNEMIIIEDRAKDEISMLVEHYNMMAQRIQNQVHEIEQYELRRNQLLSNLSHDLRTPLTMILGYAETIRNGLYKDEQELQTSAKIILQRSRYMDKLLDQLLDLTKQHTEKLQLHRSKHNLSELIRKIIIEYLLLLDEQNFTIDIEIPEQDIYADIDALLMERAIRNLLDNALRYGHEGKFIGVYLSEAAENIYIRVTDKGKGILPNELLKVYERFYRANQGRQGEGLGLGLSIVKEIVELHQGEINCTSVPYKETTFEITLG